MTIRLPIQEIDKVIEQGGHVHADKKKEEWTNIQLRISNQMLEELKPILKKRVGMSRNALILEAINEKIEKFTSNQ